MFTRLQAVALYLITCYYRAPHGECFIEQLRSDSMIGLSFLRSITLRRARQSYNSGKYSEAARRSRIGYAIFRDRESLDILARSLIRTRRYSKASRCYKRANRKGFALLEHQENHFKAEIGSENYVEAYRIMLGIKGKSKKNKCISEIVRKLKKTTDTERVVLINKMNEIANLPTDISRLLPWAPKVVEYEESFQNYPTLKKNSISAERHHREIVRIRSSGAYKISKILTDAVRKPSNLIFLPFTLPKLIIDLILNRKGLIGHESSEIQLVNSSGKRRDCIVFFPTNGVGFGHFTRLLSISRSIKKINPETEIVFFTTMPTLQLLSDEGIICYHMPGRYRYNGMSANQWNSLCEEMLSLIFTLHRPKAFIFDGSFPYRGMLNSIKSNTNDMLKVWVKRGAIKKGSKKLPVDSIKHFNAIIRPGDSVGEEFHEEMRNNIPIIKSPPILLENRDDVGAISIRNRMGIPNSAVLCYVQLGAGQINDIQSELRLTLEALINHQGVYAIVGESMLGDRVSFDHERVRILRDYPNSQYFHEFDFAVVAGGYNTYHEVINAGLPALCYPNTNTGRDDQYSRAKVASDSGAMIVLKSRNKSSIGVAISRMVDSTVRNNMRKELKSLGSENGSDTVAKWITSHFKQ